MVVNGKAVASAFVKARATIGATVTKDTKGNYGKYASLAAVMEAITPALSANGLALVQETERDDNGMITVSATILHESGETLEIIPLTLPVAKPDAQAAGSAITYARRYQLTAAFGIAPDDDDGQAASVQPARPAKPAPQRNGTPPAAPEPPADNPFEDAPWYTLARDTTTNGVRNLLDAMLAEHRTSEGECTVKQYGYLVSLINGIAGDDAHKRVLPVVCQMEVSRDNRPGVNVTEKLLKRLATHIKDAVTGDRLPNPDYSQAVADAMLAIYRAAEAVGTPKLIDA